jgi:hypothetical protein
VRTDVSRVATGGCLVVCRDVTAEVEDRFALESSVALLSDQAELLDLVARGTSLLLVLDVLARRVDHGAPREPKADAARAPRRSPG